MSLRFLLAILAFGPALAGCLYDDAPGGPPGPGPYEFVDPMSEAPEHNHTDWAQHQFRSNVTQVGFHSLVDDEGDTSQSHSIDVCQNWAVLSRGKAGQAGVDIVDLSNPADPEWVGRYRDPSAVGGDRNVAWSADCRFIFHSNEGSSADTTGIRVIDAQDKTKPVFESFYNVAPGAQLPVCPPQPNAPPVPNPPCSAGSGVHTVYALKIGDIQYVYGLNYGVHILRLEEVQGVHRLVLVGRVADANPDAIQDVNAGGPDATATRRALYGHDMTVYQEGNQVILYAAYAYAGLIIYDITNPSVPQEIGRWVPPGPGAPHYVHGVDSYMKDGKRITIVEAETFEDRNLRTASPIWITDTSDAENIKLLSTWTNPGGHGADRLLFSTHFFARDGDTLWLTHYHGGVWALDLSDPSRPLVAGYYMPAEDTAYTPSPNCCGGWKLSGVPMTFDIAVRDHVAWAADFSTGLYGLRLNATVAS